MSLHGIGVGGAPDTRHGAAEPLRAARRHRARLRDISEGTGDPMIIPERPALERRVLAALDGAGGSPRIPVLLGGCGSGRTAVLLRLRDLIGRSEAQYVDVERVATTPERFLTAVREYSPLADAQVPHSPTTPGTREAFDATLAMLDAVRGPAGAPATFLLDEFLELRTFESFPGLRTVMRDLVDVLASSGNRFVLSSRYPARALRLLRDAPEVFEVVHVTPLTPAEIRATLPASLDGLASSGTMHDADEDRAHEELARLVHALSDGRPAYARMIADTSASLDPHGDAVSALSALLAQDGALDRRCRFSYELRLHRARGYGALKAILSVLAEEEPLTLTEIALRLGRTPGSTKDYLSWLEDVDLIVSRQKRYSFADPILRLWVRLHCRPVPPGEDDIAREVHAYVMTRVPGVEPALVMAGGRAAATGKNWGIIEID